MEQTRCSPHTERERTPCLLSWPKAAYPRVVRIPPTSPWISQWSGPKHRRIQDSFPSFAHCHPELPSCGRTGHTKVPSIEGFRAHFPSLLIVTQSSSAADGQATQSTGTHTCCCRVETSRLRFCGAAGVCGATGLYEATGLAGRRRARRLSKVRRILHRGRDGGFEAFPK